MNRVAQSLHHELPLVRFAACRTFAREGYYVGHNHLGDESKVVRRAAALAHRAYANRINRVGGPGQNFDQLEYEEALAKDLGSDDDPPPPGGDPRFSLRALPRPLARPRKSRTRLLLKRLDDPDPVVQMQAVKGLWRWWYWRDDLGLRNRIEDALIAKLAAPTHPWVRRNLIEALYIIGDENIRYLYGNWIPALATKERRDRATAAQHATVNRLGEKYVAVLEKGNALQREGILRAISEFPDRPGRIGNDLEPVLFYDDALPRVSAALVRATADPDPTLRRLALQALISLRGYRDPALARAVAARQGDADAEVREAAGAAAKDFPLDLKPGRADPALVGLIGDLLISATPQAQAAALDLIARVGPTTDSDQFPEIRARLAAPSPLVRAAAFRALAAFPASFQDVGIQRNVRQALSDPDPDARVAAVRLALDPRTKTPERDLRKALEDDAPAHRVALLGMIAGNKTYASDLRLIGVVSDALDDGNQGVREKALQVIQTHPTLVSNPAIENSLRELSRSDNQRQKEIAAALLKSRGRSSGEGAAEEVLDLAYFTAQVLPVFNAIGEDGQNCVGCHRSHTILKMAPPGPDGQWSSQAARANFRAALRVVNLPKPADSLLVNKPTWEAAEEAEAQNDPTKHAHAGGVRFAKGSPEYQALLDWINAAPGSSPRIRRGPHRSQTRAPLR